MQLFYERIIKTIKARQNSLQATATHLNYFAEEKGMKTYIKPQNVNMWLKGSIPSGDYAKVLELYMYENFTAGELLEVLNIKEAVAAENK